MLQTLNQLCCPSLNPLQHLNVFPELRSPVLDRVWPHQCLVQICSFRPFPQSATADRRCHTINQIPPWCTDHCAQLSQSSPSSSRELGILIHSLTVFIPSPQLSSVPDQWFWIPSLIVHLPQNFPYEFQIPSKPIAPTRWTDGPSYPDTIPFEMPPSAISAAKSPQEILVKIPAFSIYLYFLNKSKLLSPPSELSSSCYDLYQEESEE